MIDSMCFVARGGYLSRVSRTRIDAVSVFVVKNLEFLILGFSVFQSSQKSV